VLYRKKLYVCLHLSDHKENQQIKRTSPKGAPIFETFKVSVLLGCDAIHWVDVQTHQVATVTLLNMLGTEYQLTQYHILEETLPHPQHHCSNHKTPTAVMFVVA
jgi:hypothetical protein